MRPLLAALLVAALVPATPLAGRLRASLDHLVGDLRLALRGLGRSPGFVVTSLLTLALTLGALATVLNLASGLFFRPLPVERAESLVEVSVTRGQGTELAPISHPDFVRLRERATTLEDLAAHYSTAPLFVRVGERAAELNGAVVSANFFPLLGLEPSLGRFFAQAEDSVPNRDAVAVLGWELWQSWFGGSPEVVGRTLSINDRTFTVIGVAPRGFDGVTASPSLLYLPTMTLATGYRWCADALAADCTILRMIGRLKPGRRVTEAAAEMAALVPEGWNREGGHDLGLTVRLYRGTLAGPEEARLMRLLALFAGLLIAVGTANLAGLALVRGTARARELAIRIALGAGRTRLLGQLLAESLLLGLGGGALGTLLALGTTRLLEALFYASDSAGRPLRFDFRPEPWALAALLGAAVLVALLYGGAAGLRAVRGGMAESLRSRSGGGRSRLGRWLVGLQAALAVALVALAGMVAASARTVVSGGGLEPERVALLRLRPRLLGESPERAQAYLRRVAARLEGVPGVESVTLIGTGVVLQGLSSRVARTEWADPDAQALESGFIEVGPRYFETLGTPVLAGRALEAGDTTQAPPVAVVNQTLATRLWPEGAVLGRQLLVAGREHQVVGVVADVPFDSRAQAARPYVFIPFWQNPEQVDARLAVRVAGEAAAILPTLVREVSQEDPRVPVSEIFPLDRQLAGRFRPVRMTATFLGYAAVLALLLAVLGLYSTLAAAVARRTREIAVRRAVGARAATVLVMVLRDGMTVVAAGVGCGLLLAFGSARLLQHFLYGSATDGLCFTFAGLAMAVAGLAACWLPARRAAAVEPALALREQ
ncbi:MAG TPA: ABC transporter permease [Thermoanaerobaculia bacterium]|nr:ABC transporter permease [Thermoanaerobaculia bacterium]